MLDLGRMVPTVAMRLSPLRRTRQTPIASGSTSQTTHVVATRPHCVALRACTVIGASVVELSIQRRKLCAPTADVSAETAVGSTGAQQLEVVGEASDGAEVLATALPAP